MNGASRLMVQRNKAATSVLAALMIHGRKGKAGVAPDFDWLAGMLRYVDEVVRGQHYRDEEIWLLKPLEKQMPELRPRLARVRRDHIGSGGYCVRMAEALANWQRGWERGIDMYLDNARDHYRLSASHGRLMRETILPAAERCFPEAQWQSAEAALARLDDPVGPWGGRSTRRRFAGGWADSSRHRLRRGLIQIKALVRRQEVRLQTCPRRRDEHSGDLFSCARMWRLRCLRLVPDDRSGTVQGVG